MQYRDLAKGLCNQDSFVIIIIIIQNNQVRIQSTETKLYIKYTDLPTPFL